MKFFALVLLILLTGCISRPQKRVYPPIPGIPISDQPLNLGGAGQRREDVKIILVKPRGLDPKEFHKQHATEVTYPKHIKWHIVKLKDKEKYRKYIDSGLFEQVISDRRYRIVRQPDDPLFSQQWALQKIEASAAWDISFATDVVVAILDTGINFNHPDLINNLWTGLSGEHGYTALGGRLTVGGMDDHYHGTHVAGTVGAISNNDLGVAGINWNIKLISFKFLNSQGSGSTSDAILCFDKMIDLKKSGVNIRASNNSWGGIGDDPALREAMEQASQNGILHVCAAGNNAGDNDVRPFVPASFPGNGVISVMASDQQDQRAGFSNYGLTSSDLFAPGVEILSTGTNATYLFLQGTSMASPHVAGACALALSRNTNLSVSQLKTILLHPSSLDKTEFFLNSTLGGRLNLRKLIANPFLTNPPPVIVPPVLTFATNGPLTFIPPGQSKWVGVKTKDTTSTNLLFLSTAGSDYPLPIRNFLGLGEDIRSLTNQLLMAGRLLALDQSYALDFSVADGAGGGAMTNGRTWTYRNENLVKDLSGIISNFTVSVISNQWSFQLTIFPQAEPLDSFRFGIETFGGFGYQDHCCFPVNTNIVDNLNPFTGPYAYTIRAQLWDKHGNFGNSPMVVIDQSPTGFKPPEIKLRLNTKRGTAPLQVVADMSGSKSNQSPSLRFMIGEWLGSNLLNYDLYNPIQKFTLTEPGVYFRQFRIWDGINSTGDEVVETISVLPPVKLSAVRSNKSLVLSWPKDSGHVLQESPDLSNWTSLAQTNPAFVPINKMQRYYRLERP